MWVFYSDNINRRFKCVCLGQTTAHPRDEHLHCEECFRVWQWLECDWWSNYRRFAKKAPLLVAGPEWTCKLVEVVNIGKPIRKYLAQHPNGAAVLLDSVSNVLDTLGKSEPIIHWGVMETLLAVAKPWLPSKEFTEDFVRPRMKAANANGKMVTQERFSDVVRSLPPEVQGKQIKVALADLIPTFDEAVNARHNTANLAAELGTRAHELIDRWLKRGCSWDYVDEQGDLMTTDLADEPCEVQNCVGAFLRFWARESFRYVASEMTVLDIMAGIAGTLDIIAQIGEGPEAELIVIDSKTGGGVYPQMFTQVAAYCRMAEKMGIGKVSRAFICRMEKSTAQLHIVPVFETESEYRDHCTAFASLLVLHRWEDRAAKKIKKYGPEPIPEIASAGLAPDPDFAAIIAEGEEAMASA